MLAANLLSHTHIVLAWLIFLVSYFVFAVGRLPGTRVDRTSMAVIGAVLMFLFRILAPVQGLASIDFRTIILLFSMMLIVSVLHLAGFFEWITGLIIEHLKPTHLLPGVIFTAGVLSAFLVNDVVCLFMAPLLLKITKRMEVAPLPFLLGLATASNIGSTASITGNPQNILIGSVSQIGYMDFLSRLGPVAAIGLFIAWGILHWSFRKQLHDPSPRAAAPLEPAVKPKTNYLGVPLAVTIGVLIAFLAGVPPEISAAVGAALVLLTSKQEPRKVFAEVDWPLLVFFVGLFLIIGGAEQAGIASALLSFTQQWNLHNALIFTIAITGLSNVVSNVPAVMLLKNVVGQFPNPHTAWLLLAMASTLAGNLTITGSVANIIVVEKARPEVRITFWQYLKVGIPITVATLAVGVLLLLWRH